MRNATRASTRVLCLHGWLDNRASFLPMMPHLNEFECVAVDLAGHGQSVHRERNSLNHYIDNLRDIKFILDALGWDQCHLIGHSMGGTLGLLAASTYPDSIESLSLIDILHPMPREAKKGPEMLRQSLDQFRHWDPDRQKIFPDFDSALKARLAASRLRERPANARLIMQYATEEVENGFRLRNDSRLRIVSPIMLTQVQINAFIQAVKQPVLALLATEGIQTYYPDIDTTIQLFRNIEVEHIEGGHHVHMEQPETLAALCSAFIRKNKTNTPKPPKPH